MKKIYLLILITLLACSDQTNEPVNLYSVSGIIYQNSQVSVRTNVSIDNKLNLSTTTNENGEFTITNVPEGQRSFKAYKVYDDGSFVEISSTIDVNSDIQLNSLILPNPTYLYDIEYKTDNSAIVRWSPSSASDLREYKLFRHTSSGLDETTGTLIHVSTSRFDTSFTDSKLNALTTYYYRVYVMNEFGKLGGSNIINITTDNRNFIPDGNFENISNLPATWLKSHYIGSAELDQESYSGSYSLVLISEDRSDGHGPEAGVIYKNDLNLTSNATYKLSGWFKSKGDYGWYGHFWGNPFTTYKTMLQLWINDWYTPEWSIGVEATDTTWTYVESYFSVGEVQSAKVHLRTVCEFGWFDELKLEIVE